MAEDEVRAQEALLDEIRAEAFATRRYTGRAAFDPRVLAALRRVPRHAFVPAELRQRAYANHPLPIGHGQTISQPYIVALMTDLIDPGSDDVVLEIGTGSGYQAAVLATLVKRVYTMDIVDALASDAGADRAVEARRHARHPGRRHPRVTGADGAGQGCAGPDA